MTQLVGSTPAPLPSTLTHTWIPTSDEADGTVVEILVSVNRPVTNEGRISNVTPCPPDVEMFVTKEFPTMPPLSAPFAPMAHEAPLPVALKLPLLCARQAPATNATINPVVLRTFMLPPISGMWLISVLPKSQNQNRSPLDRQRLSSVLLFRAYTLVPLPIRYQHQSLGSIRKTPVKFRSLRTVRTLARSPDKIAARVGFVRLRCGPRSGVYRDVDA